jgi:hypothetical protein
MTQRGGRSGRLSGVKEDLSPGKKWPSFRAVCRSRYATSVTAWPTTTLLGRMPSMAHLWLRAALTAWRASPHTGRDTNTGVDQMPPPSREHAADAAEEIAVYALIHAWMADDADRAS